MDAVAYLVCDKLPLPDIHIVCADFDPRLVEAKALNLVGILAQDLVHLPGHVKIQRIVRRHHHKRRAFLFRLPDGFSSLYAVFLSMLVLGQNDTMTGFGITADCNRLLTDRRAVQTFTGCVEAVRIHMQYGTHE